MNVEREVVTTLVAQTVILLMLLAALALWAVCFPYPSPLIRRWLPARKRWPQKQIRGWLENGKFHRGYLAYFYRDPQRFPDSDTGMLAPADGPVTSADVRDGVRYIVIALSFWDMHVQRSPWDGRVVAVESSGDIHTDGEGREFAFLRAKNCPVQQRVVMDTAIGRIAVRLITSVAARRIEVWVKPGEMISRGQRLGRILLGSTVVLEVPEQYVCAVPIRQRVWAGRTILVDSEQHPAVAA